MAGRASLLALGDDLVGRFLVPADYVDAEAAAGCAVRGRESSYRELADAGCPAEEDADKGSGFDEGGIGRSDSL